MTPEAEDRLRAHVSWIVQGAALPRPDADDLTEEMLGHLIERAEALIAGGAEEDDAIRAAIADFGGVAALSEELGRTYHSRLWASTIGVLLTTQGATSTPPGPVRALRLLMTVEALLWTALGAIALTTETPVHAIMAVAASVVFIGAAVLAHRALGAGQAWALTFAIGLAVVTVVLGLVGMVSAPAGTTTISITAIAAAAILVGLAGSWEQVSRFVAGSRPIGRRLELALAAALVGPALIGTALPGLADPSQAAAPDVEMRLAMDCGRRDLQIPEGPLLRDHRYADLTVDLFWRRSDLLPNGLGSLLGSSGGGDTAGFRILDPPPIPMDGGGGMPTWMLDPTPPSVNVVETGEVAGWFGSTSPSIALIPDTMGSFTVGIENDRIAARRTIRIRWSIGPQEGDQPWPLAEVAYAHLDRFLLIGQVACGQRTTGSAGRAPAPDQPRFMP
jgi:hypothetical protein